MSNSFRYVVHFISCIGLGLILFLILLVLPAIPIEQVMAQEAFTPTSTRRIPGLFRPLATLVAPPIIITRSAPTFVATNVGILDLRSIQLEDETTRTTAALAFEEQFTATVNVQSPSSMAIGESRVITLEIIPEFLAQAAMLRAELQALNFDSVDDGYPEKTVLVNTPVRWNWNIAPKLAGEQEFFLALSYVNNQGSRIHWQNIPLKVSVSMVDTPTAGATATFNDTPTLIVFEITLTPSGTSSPTLAPTLTSTPELTPVFTLTPTRTFGDKFSDDVSENPATYLGLLVTLVLGLLGVYFQYIRKSGKESSGKKNL